MTLNEAKEKVKLLRKQLSEVNEAHDRLAEEKGEIEDELEHIQETNAFDLEQKEKKIMELKREKSKLENEKCLRQQTVQNLESQIQMKESQIQVFYPFDFSLFCNIQIMFAWNWNVIFQDGEFSEKSRGATSDDIAAKHPNEGRDGGEPKTGNGNGEIAKYYAHRAMSRSIPTNRDCKWSDSTTTHRTKCKPTRNPRFKAVGQRDFTQKPITE